MFYHNMSQSQKQLARDLKTLVTEHQVSTLNSALIEFESVVETSTNAVKSLAEQTLVKELIEPLDLFIKYYQQSQTDLLSKNEQIWQKLHAERQQMVLKKEEYFNQILEFTSFQKEAADMSADLIRKNLC